MARDAIETLGTLIGEDEERDAVHVACLPAIAGEPLFPAQRIAYEEGYASTEGVAVGIVDPFLIERVMTGERFWVLLYPRTITALRHHWTHPNLPDEIKIPKPEGNPI